MTRPPAVPPVVGVGASAGGLGAFSHLLRGLPPNPGLALVYVQHLSPTHESSLPALFSKATKLPVEQARDGVTIAANRVYVIPPNTQLTVRDGRLRIGPRPVDKTQHNPIDALFRSLAESLEGRAIGVLLSGTSSDGVAGLREIRAGGGTVLVQSPDTTEFDGMPRAAIGAGVADLVLSPDQLGPALARLVTHPLISKDSGVGPQPDEGVADQDLGRVFVLLRVATGVDFRHYKGATIQRRLQRRMVLQKTTRIADYIKLLERQPTELQNLYQDLLIQVTRFFREPESYAALTDKIFPRLMADRASDAPVRIWVPGCATGEEAYSVAMTLLEFMGDAAGVMPVQVFGTDVSDRAVERARAGIYPDSIAEDVSPKRLRRFFTKIDGHYQISKLVRDLCVFARQDLTRDPPFSKLDLIMCRNVLIYMDPTLHKKLMAVFHYALRPNGFLMLGRAESTGPHNEMFQLVEKKHRIFVRKPSATRIDVEFHPSLSAAPRTPTERKASLTPRDGAGVEIQATRILMSRYAPPGVIVDGDLRIVQTRGQTGAFLQLAPGEPTLDLFKMLREGLLFAVRSALNETRRTGQPARKEGIKLRSNGDTRTVDVEVIPLTAASPAERAYLVLFDRPRAEHGREAAAERVHGHAGGRKKGQKDPKGRSRRSGGDAGAEEGRLVALQQELAANRDYLQSIIQDLEATNEELQSANEEILSANEELQSTNEELDTAKEELQSTNEEINTVNEELQSRNEELSRANSDLVNLLAGVQIAIVFVTNDLRIRRFTPMAEKALNLIPADVGRPIGNLRPNIECPDLEVLIQDAIDNVSMREQEVQDRAGRRFLLRVRPYKSIDNRIDGAVLVLLDIDDLRKNEERRRHAQEVAAVIADSIVRPLVVLDGEMRVAGSNRAFSQMFGIPTGEVAGKPLAEIADGRLDVPQVQQLLGTRAAGGAATGTAGVIVDLPRVGRQRVRLSGAKIDGPPLAVLTFEEPEPDA